MSKTKFYWSLIVIIFVLLVCTAVYYFSKSSYALFTTEVEGKQNIELSLSNETCINNPNSPVLEENMIPVIFDENLKVWKKADENNPGNSWYNYCQKKWANVVTVKDSEKYLNTEIGGVIPSEDINSMFVWIPRYKYQIFNYNYNGETSINEQIIRLAFEEKNETTGDFKCKTNEQGVEECTYEKVCMSNDCNGKTYTHPAFEKSLGFWVSKFELSGELNDIKIVPQTMAITKASVRDFNDAISDMNEKNNPYGFDEKTKIYMINNLQWGAVAYLSNSKYGKGEEVALNNCERMITGIGSTATKKSEVSCNNNDNLYYGEEGMQASTTGNVYGVYDMSGGSSEIVLGVLSENKEIIPGLSGYTSSEKIENINLYKKTETSENITISKLGDGIREVKNNNYSWNEDLSYVAYNKFSWFTRGGSYKDEKKAGIFASSYSSGSGAEDTSTRVVIVK